MKLFTYMTLYVCTYVGSGGHVLGYGGEATSSASTNPLSVAAASATSKGEPLHHSDVTTKEEENELMEIDDLKQDRELLHSDDSDSDSDDDENAPGNQNHPMFPPPPRNVGLPQAFGRRRGRLPWGRGPIGGQFPGLGGGSDDEDDDEMFEGQGHRLGGKEVPPKLGDLQLGEIRMHDAGMFSLSLSLCTNF